MPVKGREIVRCSVYLLRSRKKASQVRGIIFFLPLQLLPLGIN